MSDSKRKTKTYTPREGGSRVVEPNPPAASSKKRRSPKNGGKSDA